jgi:sulfite reductase alpha subunit
MAKQMINTPNLDDLESGPWPSFVTGIKRLAKDNDMMVDLMGQLETSYQTKFGYWKGGTVGVIGYGAGIIPRFTELKNSDGTPSSPKPPNSTPCASSRRPACTTPPTCCARCATPGWRPAARA